MSILTAVGRLLQFMAIIVSAYYLAIGLDRWHESGQTDIYNFICPLVIIFFSGNLLAGFLYSFGLTVKTRKQNIQLALFSICLAILCLELALRSPVFARLNIQTYNERNGGPEYNSPFTIGLQECKSCGKKSFYIRPPFDSVNVSCYEYKYNWVSNSCGLRDKEFTAQKGAKEFRILGLGDSFTEGMGTPEDSTWLKQLEYRLNSRPSEVTYSTMNGGVAGSDLFFSYHLLKYCLLQYHPDLVILDLNSTDIGDVLYRGGDERFDSTGHFTGCPHPWWEFLFGSSYIARLIIMKGFRIGWEFFPNRQYEIRKKEAIDKIAKKVNDFQELATQKGFAFLLVLQPVSYEALTNENPFSRMRLDPAIKRVDMLKYMQAAIPKDSITTYYWPLDLHFKTKGYGMMAQSIYEGYFFAR